MIALTNALPEWQDDALCREVDPELFYPPKGGDPRPAKSICFGCEVRNECLQYALNRNEPFGIWGGTTESERRSILRGPRGASIHPIRQRPARFGPATHHQAIAAMISRPTPATWAEIGRALGYTAGSVKKYWHRQVNAAKQQEQAA